MKTEKLFPGLFIVALHEEDSDFETGLSFTGYNPESEDFYPMSVETAERLFDRLSPLTVID
jgi:hypothetical protein